MEPLKVAYRRICRDYFSHWADAVNWKLTKRPRLKYTQECGYCVKARKTFHLPGWRPGDNGDLLLIHEICHAVTALNHEKRWQDRMIAAAARAEALGASSLGQMLRDKVESYRHGISEEVELAAVMDSLLEVARTQTTSFISAFRTSAGEVGLSVSELRKRLPNAQKEFEEERAEEAERKRNFSSLHKAQ